MKNKAKKVLISICIICTIFNLFSNTVRAEGPLSDDEINGLNSFDNALGSTIDGIAGIGTVWIRGISYAAASTLNVILSALFSMGGMGTLQNWGTSNGTRPLDISDILFADANGNSGGVKITSIDFFNISSDPGHANTIMILRQNIANWYYSFRNLSIVALLLILLYVGIRMAIASVGEEEAKYKKMLKDWATSLVLVFVMQYLMIFIIEINKVLVTILYHTMIDDRVTWYGGIRNVFGNASTWDNYMTEIGANVFHWSFTVGWGSLFIYCIMIFTTFIFLFNYIKRMTTVAFLIMISPLITITYSIDKMKDGKSQALDTWLKEFTYNVLINPFHCIIYMVFVTIALGLMENARSIGSSVFAILMILFMFKAEEIVKKIFNFQSSSLQNVLSSAAAIGTGLNLAKKLGGKAANKARNASEIPEFEDDSDFQHMKIGDENSNINKQSQQAKDNTNATENMQNGSSGKTEGNEYTPYNFSEQNTSNNDYSNNFATSGNDKDNSEGDGKRTIWNKAGGFIKNNSGKIITAAVTAPITLGAGLTIGGLEGLAAGFTTTGSIVDGIMGFRNNAATKKVIKQRENAFKTNGYGVYQVQSGYTHKQMKKKTQLLLNATQEDEEKMSEDEYYYYLWLNHMKNKVYEEGNGNDRIMEYLDKIESGEEQIDYDAVNEQIRLRNDKKSGKTT